MSRRTATWLAWSLCGLSLALTALSHLLLNLNSLSQTPIFTTTGSTIPLWG
jgi:hypothetical protein